MKRAFDPRLLEAFRFHFTHGGSIVGQRAKGALRAARAELEARKRGWEVSWEYDECHDLGPRDWGWSEKECKRWEEEPHECLVASLEDENGFVLASCGGIWDPDCASWRVMAAELAMEALENERIERQRTATATLWDPVC